LIEEAPETRPNSDIKDKPSRISRNVIAVLTMYDRDL